MLKMQVIGFLGKDADVNNANGKTVINFNVAHTDKFNGTEKTTWVQCAYWTEKTGIAPYLKKGTQIYVEGNPEVKTYPKNDGTQGVCLTLRVGQVQLLGSAPGDYQDQRVQQPRPQAQTPTNAPGQYETEVIADLPF